MTHETDEPSGSDALPRYGRTVLGLTLAASLVLALSGGPRLGLSVLVGGGFCLLNLWLLGRIVAALVKGAQGEEGASAGWALVAVLKLFLGLALLGVAITLGDLSAGGLGIGIATLPIGIALTAVVCDRKPDAG